LWVRFLEAMTLCAAGRYSIHLMIERAIQTLRLLTARHVLRGAVLVICALAFVTVTVAHGAQHLHGAAHAAVALSDVLPSGDGPDPDLATSAVDHCGACAVTMPSASTAVLCAPPQLADRIAALRHDPRAFDPAAETRPPIALI
jgi:hypothetical protein